MTLIRQLCTVAVLTISLPAKADSAAKKIMDADIITWVGVDYTQAKFISTVDFRNEDEVVKEYPKKWNGMVIHELTDDLQSRLKRAVTADIGGMTKLNDSCSVEQIIREEGGVEQTHLSNDAIAKQVKAWDLKPAEGVGLGIVVDRFVKMHEKGCVWPVFFDLKNREVLHTERVCHEGSGFGFRNFWFRPIKDTITDDLKSMMKGFKKAAKK